MRMTSKMMIGSVTKTLSNDVGSLSRVMFTILCQHETDTCSDTTGENINPRLVLTEELFILIPDRLNQLDILPSPS